MDAGVSPAGGRFTHPARATHVRSPPLARRIVVVVVVLAIAAAAMLQGVAPGFPGGDAPPFHRRPPFDKSAATPPMRTRPRHRRRSLAITLGKASRVRHRAPDLGARARQAGGTASEIGAALDVHGVLTGRRRSGERLRLTAELVDHAVRRARLVGTVRGDEHDLFAGRPCLGRHRRGAACAHRRGRHRGTPVVARGTGDRERMTSTSAAATSEPAQRGWQSSGDRLLHKAHRRDPAYMPRSPGSPDAYGRERVLHYLRPRRVRARRRRWRAGP